MRLSLLPLSYAWREMRAGMGGFRVFVASIALGVTTIAAVGSLSRGLSEGLAREGRTILGGDIAFSLIHRQASVDESRFLAGAGQLGVIATTRAMARHAENATLAEVKAVDGAYPLAGTVEIDPPQSLAQALAPRDGIAGAVVETALLIRIGAKVDDLLQLGDTRVRITGVLRSEPDKLAGGLGFGPRLMLSLDTLQASGLIQPGSLIRWHYRLALAGEDAGGTAANALSAEANRRFPQAGWEIRTRTNASPQLGRNIERFTQFLALVGMTALLIGGVGVANSVRAHIQRKREDIAILKAVGATGGEAFLILLAQVALMALLAILGGLVVGALVPYGVAFGINHVLPVPLAPTLAWGQLGLAALYGGLIALAFTLWPLGRAHDIPVSALFRDNLAEDRRWPRPRYWLMAALVAATLIAVALLASYERRIAVFFILAAGAIFLVLRLIAMLLTWGAAKLPRARSALVRMAIANIHRPGALTGSIVLSLGLGLTLLVTLVQIDGNLRLQLTKALPDRAPSFFFADVPSAEAEAFDAFLAREAPRARQSRVPMLRGRIVMVRGVRAEDVRAEPDVGWIFEGDRGITYSQTVPDGSRLVEGGWWAPDYAGPPLVSLEKRIAEGVGLKLGDSIAVNVLGRTIEAKVANLRQVEWRSMGINFVMVFSPATFRGAPHTHLSTLTFPDGGETAEELTLLRKVATSWPMIATVRVKDALEAVAALAGNLAAAVRWASLVTLGASVLVLAGAMAAGERQRRLDAAILRALGATRRQLVLGFALEYALLGAATALLAVAAGSLAARQIVVSLMNTNFTWLPFEAFAVALAALLLTVLLGLAGTWRALSVKPASLLRDG